MSAPAAPQAPARAILLFLLTTCAARLVALFATGFCDDEAYVVAISRAPALSYFDHPPLHQWMLWAWTQGFGEGRAARLPFFGCTLLTTFGLWGLSRRLFGAAAAAWAAFAFAASGYFLVYPDGYILPDAPLFAALTLGVWAVAEILFRPPGRETPLWLAAGLAFGLAGLSKYSAIFVPFGLAGYVLTRAPRRLADPRPFAAALLALAMLTPVWLWNARHGWVSLAFQSGRAAQGAAFGGRAWGEIAAALGAQVGALTPWIAIPVLAGLASARGEQGKFLLWQALPPLAAVTLLPLTGTAPIAHWYNSGWLFAYPLAGAWLAGRGARFQRGFLAATAALSAVVMAGYVAAVRLGPWPLAHDPTRQMFDWPAAPLRDALAEAGAEFVLIDNWRVGGRIGVALGPKIPVCAQGDDPRGFTFACDARAFLGRNALVVHEAGRGGPDASGLFARLAPLPPLAFGRNGAKERRLDLSVGQSLQRAPALPY